MQNKNSIGMEKIKQTFLSLVRGNVPVNKMIPLLVGQNAGGTSAESSDKKEILAYQAYCCALMARDAKSRLQQIQYVKEYNALIQHSLYLDSQGISARLVRFLIEKNLKNVIFVSHADEDRQFLTEHAADDKDMEELIEKILAA